MANDTAAGGERSKKKRATAGKSRPRPASSVASAAAPSLPSSASGKRGRDPLLAAICHDLRAPLAAVTMGANFVLQTTTRDENNARSVKILEAMLRSCTQMERLIRNFADLSEIEGNAVNLRLGLHDASEMLELAAAAMQELAQSRSVSVEVFKPEHPIALRCDRERLLRSVGHVVENAVKFAPPGSSVSLSVSLSSGLVAFAVVDRGPGLTREVRDNLYDRHWHAQRANRVGAGLGLSIARGFLAAHEGRLDVASRPDVETKFTLFVPEAGPQVA